MADLSKIKAANLTNYNILCRMMSYKNVLKNVNEADLQQDQ